MHTMKAAIPTKSFCAVLLLFSELVRPPDKRATLGVCQAMDMSFDDLPVFDRVLRNLHSRHIAMCRGSRIGTHAEEDSIALNHLCNCGIELHTRPDYAIRLYFDSFRYYALDFEKIEMIHIRIRHLAAHFEHIKLSDPHVGRFFAALYPYSLF